VVKESALSAGKGHRGEHLNGDARGYETQRKREGAAAREKADLSKVKNDEGRKKKNYNLG